MPCYHPIQAWHSSESTSNGKRKVYFRKPAGYSNKIQLPCSTCIGCRLDRSLLWAIRCINEAQLHNQNSFITLTYADEHLPWDGSLIKSHCQKFIKRLRRTYPSQTIRYYMCGEYGEKLSRPHYHVCLFGLDFPDKEIFSQREGLLTYTSDTLDQIWGKGFCTIGELNFQTAAYTARYIAKKITGKNAPDHYTTTCIHTGNIINLEPEYNSMSLKPAIGKDWFDKYKTDAYPSDYLIHNARKVKIPRYYDKLFERIGGNIDEIKKNRKRNAKKFAHDNTPERLAVREKIQIKRFKKLTRNIENDS